MAGLGGATIGAWATFSSADQAAKEQIKASIDTEQRALREVAYQKFLEDAEQARFYLELHYHCTHPEAPDKPEALALGTGNCGYFTSSYRGKGAVLDEGLRAVQTHGDAAAYQLADSLRSTIVASDEVLTRDATGRLEQSAAQIGQFQRLMCDQLSVTGDSPNC